MRPWTVSTGFRGQHRRGGGEPQRAALDAPGIGAAREGDQGAQPLAERHAQLRAAVPALQLQVQRHGSLGRLGKRLGQLACHPDQA